MSVEIGKNDLKLKKVAMLGAMKPAVAETAINFSLEDEMQHLENVICFEFDLMDTTTVETTPNVPVMLEDAKGFVKFATDEEKFALLQEIMETGFSDQFKKAAQTMAYNFGKVEEPVIQFSEEHKKDKAELLQFRSETLSKLVKGKFLPRQEKDVNKMIQFMAVNGSDVYSFSEEEKEKPHVLFGKILAEMPDLSKVYGMKFNAEDVKAVEEVGEAKTATQVTIDIYNKAMEVNK